MAVSYGMKTVASLGLTLSGQELTVAYVHQLSYLLPDMKFDAGWSALKVKEVVLRLEVAAVGTVGTVSELAVAVSVRKLAASLTLMELVFVVSSLARDNFGSVIKLAASVTVSELAALVTMLELAALVSVPMLAALA